MKARLNRDSEDGRSASTAGIDAAAADWVLRSNAGEGAASQRELVAWLQKDPRHQEAYDRLSGTWAVFDRAERAGATDEILAKLRTRTRRRRAGWQLAAVSAIVFGGAALWIERSTPSRPPALPLVALPARPPSDSIRKLPDGSIVELNEHAEIAIRYESSVRRVLLLRGEALFRVEKEPARPFLVQAGSVEVRAVGTAFNVRLEEKAVEVLVTHGTVRVEDAVNRLSLVPAPDPVGDAAAAASEQDGVLVAGQRMVVTMPALDVPAEARPEVRIASLAPEEIDQRLAWRIPQLEFGGMELAQAIALLNRHNRLQISTGDAATAKLRISGVFRSDNPEGFLLIVEATFGLRADRIGEHEVILRGAR